MHVEIPSPANAEKKEEEISPVVKQPAPIFFDDNDFETLEKPKVEPKVEEVKPTLKTDAYKGAPKKEEKKAFVPSPIISPVYGVLDKNYHKEDITSRNDRDNEYTLSSKDMTIDDVRRKAYGTLEDDLENTLFGKNSILFSDIKEEPKEEIDIFDELDILNDKKGTPNASELINNDDMQVKKYRETRKIEVTLEHKNEEIADNKKVVAEDDSVDGELLNFIDSMVEEGDNK